MFPRGAPQQFKDTVSLFVSSLGTDRARRVLSAAGGVAKLFG